MERFVIAMNDDDGDYDDELKIDVERGNVWHSETERKRDSAILYETRITTTTTTIYIYIFP